MTLTLESAHAQLALLIQEMPNLWTYSGMDPEENKWLGKACALVDVAGTPADSITMGVAAQNLTTALREMNVQTVIAILHRTLASLELKLPVAAQGAFVVAGNAFDALAAIGKILSSAKLDVLIVDPYMDNKALEEFAVLASERVSVRLLSDQATVKPSLRPAVAAWRQQYDAKRPVEARVAPPKTLHDRLIIADGKEAYLLTQSLNAFATRAPASIVRADAETGALKVMAYGDIWNAASQI